MPNATATQLRPEIMDMAATVVAEAIAGDDLGDWRVQVDGQAIEISNGDTEMVVAEWDYDDLQWVGQCCGDIITGDEVAEVALAVMREAAAESAPDPKVHWDVRARFPR